MTTRFCYHCQIWHEESEMRMVESRSGKRWRCVRSIEAAKRSADLRDAFGRKTTERNKADARAHALRFSMQLGK